MKPNILNVARLSILGALLVGLVSCGGGEGATETAQTATAERTPTVIPLGMSGVSKVGEEYQGAVQVNLEGSTLTVVGFNIENSTVGGGKPNIDATGNIRWNPNDEDFLNAASLHVMVRLSDGSEVTEDIRMDVRKSRFVLDVALSPDDRIYLDETGRYSIRVTKVDSGISNSGNLRITEVYRNSGEFSWLLETSSNTSKVVILQAPTTQIASLTQGVTAKISRLAVSPASAAYPVTPLAAGVGYFFNLQEKGSVVGSYDGVNLYTSRPAGFVNYKLRDPILNNAISSIKSLDSFDVFAFGSNCSANCANLAKNKSPIILIHGFSGLDNAFSESIKGGGEDTWGKTTKLLTDEGYPVYEMKWMSYMPFEDAAGMLAKFGKDVATATGKKPIILAHSFGGVVSHLALQNKGREWKSTAYGDGEWQTVNSDGVFLKLITLNSPLSGINGSSKTRKFDAIKKIYDDAGRLVDVSLPQGDDLDDSLIGKCYAITCVQAGANFFNSTNYVSLVAKKGMIDGDTPVLISTNQMVESGITKPLAEGDVISSIRNGITEAKNNAPFLSVVGIRIITRRNDNINYGDGLISILGQAAIPQDFSDQAFSDVSVGDGSFHLKFEAGNFPSLLKGSVALNNVEKGDCLKYSISGRDYLICSYSAHTASKVIAPQSLDPMGLSYPVANYNPNLEDPRHVMPRLVLGTKYLAVPTEASPFSVAAYLSSIVKGRFVSSAPAKPLVAVRGARAQAQATSTTTIARALVWATFIEKNTGAKRHYFQAAESDSFGNFNIDVGAGLVKIFGADVKVSDYRISLKTDVVGYLPWVKVIENLDVATDLGDIDLSNPSATADLLNNGGFGSLESWNGSCPAGTTGCSVYAGVHLTVGGGGLWHGERWRSSGGAPFVKLPEEAVDGWSLTEAGWVATRADEGRYVVQPDGNVRVSGSEFGATGAIASARVQDLAGQPMSLAGETGTTASTTFPAGAEGYWWSFQRSEDNYYAKDKVSINVGTGAVNPTSLSDLVNRMRSSAGGWNGLMFRFDAPLASAGAVNFFSPADGSTLGSGQYELRTVRGQQVLVITQVPAAALADAATRDSSIYREYANGERPIFGAVGGAVYIGRTTPAGMSTEERPALNKVALNAILAARGLCTLPDASGASVCPPPPPPPPPAVTIPMAPTGVAPGTNTASGPLLGAAMQFHWDASAGATDYVVAFFDISTGVQTYVQTSTLTFLLGSVGLIAGESRVYDWGVAACNSAGCSNYSPLLRFRRQ